jgi:hypothetical protein
MNSSATRHSEKPAAPANLYLAGTAAFPILFATLLTIVIKSVVAFDTVGAVTRHAEIHEPRNNQPIGRHYRVSGSIRQVPESAKLFVIERDSNGIYPKVSIPAGSRHWEYDLYTGLPTGMDFRVIVVAIDQRDHDRFIRWLKNGESTGRYPPLNSVQSITELSAVTVSVNTATNHE